MIRGLSMRRVSGASVLVLVASLSIAPRSEAGAAGAQSNVPLSPPQMRQLAEQFAPTLLFHPDEQYFPSSPLFPLSIVGTDSETAVRLLGTPESRAADYRALTLEEKSGIATVYYRAYPSRHDGRAVVVLEYWLYYVQNDYRVRANVLPFWFDRSHPNDLEHIHVILRPLSGALQDADASAGGFVVDEVYASAHQGYFPANRYKQLPAEGIGPSRFLVERGSHAMAPDINEDGRFTSGTDGDSGHKMQWGIRDRGKTWVPYNPSYMDVRLADDAPLFTHQPFEELFGDEPRQSPPGGPSYRLVSVESLSAAFEQLSLTDTQREQVFEKDKHWFLRVFGSDNGSSETLLVPPRPQLGGDSVGIDGLSSNERGILLGTTLNADEPGFFVGGRYSFLTGSRFLPDVVLEADGIRTTEKGYLSSQFMLSYPIDGSTRVMGGRELITDSITFERHQWNWLGAVEVRLGSMRFQAAFRSIGPVMGLSKEFRLSHFF